jgi:hypothetical protein
MDHTEARIARENQVLLALSPLEDEGVRREFGGVVVAFQEGAAVLPELVGKSVYVCGGLSRLQGLVPEDARRLGEAKRVMVVEGLSDVERPYDARVPEGWEVVERARLPVSVHGLGVYYRRFFEVGVDYFGRICAEHRFQSLTESNKPGTAHRTGIYLTQVEQDGEGLGFRLLRCSTNLSGPTENFRACDRHLVDALNQEAAFVFEGHAPLNHVLAQVYHNTPSTEAKKQSKAKIAAHADKTKDMPREGVMAFCTFYDGLDKLRPLPKDPLDYGYKETSGLTRLCFRLKASNGGEGEEGLPQQFSITLYPNSVFLMPLSTNRLYTHEVQPSSLDAAMLPTRLGYVVRCSKAEAVHRGGLTSLKRGEALTPLEPPTEEGMQELRRLYAEENKRRTFIEYGDQFRFSMNQGDYLAPSYRPADEFRVYDLGGHAPSFEELVGSVRWEDVGKGRRGAVLALPDEARGVPLVRTTTRYQTPAQRFGAVHARLARSVQRNASLEVGFNHALIERYERSYASMGAHSDQALDLEDGAWIALVSCYAHPDRAESLRKLVVEPKEPGGEPFEVVLGHQSVVVFSVKTNGRFRHKIILDAPASAPENLWVGVTFRTSKTFVRLRGGQAWLSDDTALTLADEPQQKEFFQLRRRENQEVGFVYPHLGYTLSESDLRPPPRRPLDGDPPP